MNDGSTPAGQRGIGGFAGATLVALICGSAILMISLGIRHSFGLFLQPASLQHGWGRETFGFAIAIQNLVWGVSQPFVGMLADRFGATRLTLASAVLYAGGLAIMAQVADPVVFVFGTGVIIGLALAGASFSVIFGTISRLVEPEKRSLALGITASVGSFGQFAILPLALVLIEALGWQGTLLVYAAMCLLLVPLALGLREDGVAAASGPGLRAMDALREAFAMRDFWLLTFGFFACGFQVVFIGTHLPAYLADKGIASSVAVTVLALIGLFNIAGTYYSGVLGGRMRKPMLLVWIYIARAIAIAAFVLMPVSALSAYIFGMVIGLLWLSTVPLTNGTVSSVWGVKNMSMLGGIVFFSHQMGSFLGSWLGGLLYDVTGNYNIAWGIAIGVSLLAAALNWPISERSVAQRQAAAAPG